MFLRNGRRRALSTRQAQRMVSELRLGAHYAMKKVAARYGVTTRTAWKYLQKSNHGEPL